MNFLKVFFFYIICVINITLMSTVYIFYNILFMKEKFKENYSRIISDEILNRGVADYIVKSNINAERFLISYLIAKTVPLLLFPKTRASVCDSVYESCIRRIKWMSKTK